MGERSDVMVSAGKLRLTLSPFAGGAIAAFEWIDNDVARPIMRRCDSPLERVLDAASFPLVPYVNRIRGGTFTFRGREVRLTANMAGDPNPLHGQGWLHQWAVEAANENRAALSYHHVPDEWPWAYEAAQQFDLNELGLSLSLTCRNTSDEPMPCGLGQHPYFPCGAETRIDTQVAEVWTIDEHVLPVDRIPATGRYDLGDRPVCGQGLDHGFGDWGGQARLTDPDWPYDLRLSSSDARFFQLYSPQEGGIFVAEPVSHANAALNAPEDQWPGLGLRVLEPGEEMSLAMRLDVMPK